MLRYLLASAVLHGAVLGFTFLPSPKRPIAIDVEIKTRDVAPEKEKKLNLKPTKEAPRLGSDAYRRTHRKLGDTLASEHYLERLHAHVDPHWIFFVKKARLKAACITVLNIDADANGTVLTVIVLQSTCPPRLRSAAVDAIWYANLLPPPKLFLDSRGILKLEWYFILKPKD